LIKIRTKLNLKIIKAAFVAILLAFSESAFCSAPPAPGELADYKNDGSLSTRVEFMKEISNHKISPELLKRAMYKMDQLMAAEGIVEKSAMAPPPAWKGLPTTGVVKIPVIGLEFSDYPATYSPAEIDDVVFGDGDVLIGDFFPYESLANYYDRSSYGQLTITGNVLGWYDAGVPRASIPETNADRRELIKDALDYFDSLGHDFSQYDNDGDGKIDYIIFLWAGPNSGWGGFWWSYKSTFTDYAYTIDGKMLDVFSWNWETYYELPDPPAKLNPKTLIHETGHALGLPDYYDYDDSVGPDGGVGGLDMMDSSQGDHNAFSKFLLGWITPDVYFSGTNSISLAASHDSSDAAIVMPEASLGKDYYEYFIVQNRAQDGNDSNFPGEGLTIWHVDSTLNEQGSNFLYDNSYTDRKLLRLMEADGLEEIEAGGTADAGDYYTDGDELSPASTPNSDRYNGIATGITIDNISVPGASMTLDVSFSDAFFTVVSATVSGPTSIDILYNLDISASLTAADPANYNVNNGIGEPSAATAMPDGMTIRLTTSALSECVTYEVAITGVLSGAGDPLYPEASPATVSGNGIILVNDIEHDTVWSPANNPYCPSTDIFVTDGATLTIEPGVIVKFFPHVADADYGWSDLADIIVSNGGGIIASGTEADPIVFTSLAESPAQGDWGALLIFGTALDVLEIAYINFSYAKYGLMITGKSPVVEFCEFRETSSFGIFTDSYSEALIRNNLFADSYGGIYTKSNITAVANSFEGIEIVGFFFEPAGKNATLKENNFIDSDAYALYSQTAGDITNATHNYFSGNANDTGTNCEPACPINTQYKLTAGVDRLMSPSSLKLKSDSSYLADLGGDTGPGATLFIQLVGNNGDPAIINQTVIHARSSSTSPSGIYVTLTETAAGSGIYRGTATLHDTSSDQSLNQLGAAIGETIYIASVRTPEIGDSAVIQPDLSPPDDIADVYDGEGADIDWTTSASALKANWTESSDPESGIARYWHAIGTTPGGTEISTWTDTGTDTSVTRSGLTLTDGQTYFFSARAENGAGLLSGITSSDGQTVDSSPPTSVAPVNDGSGADIDYSSSTDELSANWSAATDLHSGLARYLFAIGATPGGTDIVDWTDNALSASMTQTGLSLSSGQTYYVSVRAENGVGLFSTEVSDGITIDTSAPSAPGPVNDGPDSDMEFAGSTTELTANWTASSDSESGISRYWYAIGSAPGDTDIAGWTDNGASLTVTHSGLVLVEGQTYYFTVRAENGAGLLSTATNSDGQTVDTSSPTDVATVNDGPGVDIDWTTSSSSLVANWTTSSDPHSGILGYWFAIGTAPGASDVVAWTDNGDSTSATVSSLVLADGQTYYFSVQAENGAGLFSTPTSSNGQTVDSSPPATVSYVYDGAGADIDYSTDSDELSANWSASSDAHSGVSSYRFAVGTTSGNDNIVPWTDNGNSTSATVSSLSLTDGQMYYFSVKAVNGVGLLSTAATSDGVRIDASPPSAPTDVNDGLSSDIDYTSSTTSMSANWTASSDPHTGITAYRRAVGTSPGSDDISAWAANGSGISSVVSGLSLSHGQTYYFSIKAENGAGLLSAASSSDGIVVDTTPPNPVAAVNDGLGADIEWTTSLTSLSANWNAASDPESGVSGYWRAVGTSPGYDDIVSWSYLGNDTAVSLSGLSLSHAQTYYLSIRTENRAGLLSTTTSSDGITVDVMPPEKYGFVPSDGAKIGTIAPLIAFTTDESAECRWAATDLSYLNMIHSCASGDDVSHECSVFGLAEGPSEIYIACEDALGNNDTVASNTLLSYTVDLTPPVASSFSPPDGGYLTSAAPPITFTTNETSICRWFFSDLSYNAMPPENQCSAALTTTHTCTASTSAPGPLSLFFACVDSVENSHSDSQNYRLDYFVDTTPPEPLEYVYDGLGADIDIFTDPTQISANWATGSDPESGFNRYTYSVGTSPGSANIVPWVSIGSATSVTRYSLPLIISHTYYFCARAVNNAGLASTMTCSNGQTLYTEDFTPPSAVPYVYDGEGADMDWSQSISTLSANWGESSDPESGIASYKFAVGTSAGATNIVGWTDNGLDVSVLLEDLSLTDGAIYYFSVKAVNGWGLESSATVSDGIRIDATPPAAPATVTDGASGDDIDWSSVSTSLSARWSASSDPQSGVVRYWRAVGSSPGDDDISAWTSNALSLSATLTGLSLQEGQKYYFSVKAENNSGLMSSVASSDGFTVDLTPPSPVPFVYDGLATDITFCGSLTQLSANWGQSADSASGIASYKYAIGRSPGASDVVSWTSAGASTSVTKSGLTLSLGQMYYFSVKAVDVAGLESTVVSSNGQTPDVEPPDDVSSLSAQPGNSLIALSWTNPGDADFEGVKILRKQGNYPLNILDGDLIYEGTAESYTDSSVSEGPVYYYTAFAFDGALNYSAGLTSGARASAALTPPGLFIREGWNLVGASKQNMAFAIIATAPGASTQISRVSSTGVWFHTSGGYMDIGSAYWVHSATELGTISTSGGTTYSGSSRSAPLTPGWNMIASPFTQSTLWINANASISCGGSPISLPPVYYYVAGSGYVKIEPNTGGSISPWRGYMLNAGALSNCVLTLTK